MPFSLSNVPKRNPGRYFEQFVKIVQPVGEGGQTGAAQFLFELIICHFTVDRVFNKHGRLGFTRVARGNNI